MDASAFLVIVVQLLNTVAIDSQKQADVCLRHRVEEFPCSHDLLSATGTSIIGQQHNVLDSRSGLAQALAVKINIFATVSACTHPREMYANK